MNNNREIKYVLFYSNKCIHCKNLMNQMNKNNIKSKFNFFCIDDNYNKIPSSIKSVPSILFKDNNTILVGKSVFNWLNEQTTNTPSQNEQNQEPQNQDGPLAWHGAEMGGAMSDNYSFLNSDTSAQGTGGASIAHNFSFLSDGNQKFNSPDTKDNSFSGTREKDQLTQNMEIMMSQRDNDVSGAVQRY
jgi:hypothetical protein